MYRHRRVLRSCSRNPSTDLNVHSTTYAKTRLESVIYIKFNMRWVYLGNMVKIPLRAMTCSSPQPKSPWNSCQVPLAYLFSLPLKQDGLKSVLNIIEWTFKWTDQLRYVLAVFAYIFSWQCSKIISTKYCSGWNI